MRTLNMNMILAATLFSTLACGDDGATDGADTTAGTGTASETASGDGDGDGDPGDGDPGDGDGDGDPGDGDPGDGDPGDGDPGDGDGDGDPGDGDPGDGDPGDGDGDGDPGCAPMADTPCAMCTAENCCDEITACQEDEDCACLTDCIQQGIDIMGCFPMCGLMINTMNPELMALRACTNNECMQQCAMP
jgi:hypothetical protein